MQSNIVCKEHEWISGDLVWGDDRNVKFVINENGRYKVQIPENKIATDFHIEENLSQINKQEWEDIWDEFKKTDWHKYHPPELFRILYGWLKEKYAAPKKMYEE